MGSIMEKKGIGLLVNAFRGDLGKQLTIRGFRDKRALTQFRLKHPGFRAQLELFNPDKASFFKKVDVVIVPSIWYENQPAVIIEAFNYGKPVICSDLGAFPELVEDNVSGLLFKTGDANDLKEKISYLNARPMEIHRLAAGIPSWPSVFENVNKILDEFKTLKLQNRYIACNTPGN
jgi:glycosyltransferase involved in cell wall biosynthesis